MLNTLRLFHELETTLDTPAAEKIADIIGRVYDDLQNTVTKTEFRELTEIVQDLGEAQKRTETRLEELTQVQKELAEAQKRTETRLEELAEAQKRTESRLEELAEAQKRTETRLAELAEAQKQTEYTLQKLARNVAENTQEVETLKTHFGGLANTVGYGLEDKAYQSLPRLLRRDFGIETREPLYRRFVADNKGKQIEVNIFSAAERNGETIQVLGEAKSQLSRRKVDEFLRKKVRRLQGAYPPLFPILITYMISEPDVEKYANEKGVHLYYSYQFMES